MYICIICIYVFKILFTYMRVCVHVYMYICISDSMNAYVLFWHSASCTQPLVIQHSTPSA